MIVLIPHLLIFIRLKIVGTVMVFVFHVPLSIHIVIIMILVYSVRITRRFIEKKISMFLWNGNINT